MSENRTSAVWKHFEIEQNNSSRAKCQLCNASISRGGTGENATATAMINHLKNEHYHEYLDYQGATSEQKKKRKLEQEVLKEEEANKKVYKQMTLSEAFNKNKLFGH